MMYEVYGCGGDRDGELVLRAESYADAANKAREVEDEFELGCFIIDEKGREVEW